MDDNTPPIRMNIPIMRYSFRTLAAPVAVVLLAGSSDLMAQVARPKTTTNNTAPSNAGPKQAQAPAGGQRQPQAAAGPQRQANVPVAPLVAPPIPKRPVHTAQSMAKRDLILEEWEEKSSKIKSLHGKHKRRSVNIVYEQEAVSEGQFFLQTPDKGRIDLQGVKPAKNAVGTYKDSHDKPYRVVEGQSERWICTGDEIVMVNEADKSYEVLPIPDDQKGANIIHSPLPFLFGMKAEAARKRFDIFIGKTTAEEVYLTVYPLEEQDSANYSKAQIVLDRTLYLPTFVKLIDHDQITEYEFDSVKVNDKNPLAAIQKWWGGDKDPFHPELRKKGYKLVVHPPAQGGVVPAGNVVPIQNRK